MSSEQVSRQQHRASLAAALDKNATLRELLRGLDLE
jgi:hypothetical protein